jgi:outer membrane protein assembly factor BamB
MRHPLRLIAALATLAACTSSEPVKSEPAPVPVAPRPVVEPVKPAPVEPPGPAGEFDVSGIVGGHQETTPPVSRRQYAKLSEKWTAKIGKTTFRTTMALSDGLVVIGTHGATLAGKNEASDGVYLLDARTGKQSALVRTPGSGDRDVGGIAVDKGTVYFTTDNGQIVAATLAGKTVWTAQASGKVRPAPALADLDGDGAVDVIVGDESGALRALAGATGKPLWTVKTGESEYGARGYIAAVAIADLDGDGHDDVVAAARDAILAAYRGKDGAVLWQHGGGSGVHASPTVADFDLDGKPEVLAAWSYGEVSVHDGNTGAVRWGTSLQRDDGGIEGLFATPTPLPGGPGESGVLVAGTAWWDEADGVILVGPGSRKFRAFEGRVTASPVVVDLDGDGHPEAIVGSEKGVLLAFTADGRRAELARLGGAIEAPAMLADVDLDGTLELLVASNDGVLTCFATAATARPYLSRFRGESPHNRGDLGKTALAWRGGKAGEQQMPPKPGTGIRIDYIRCCQALVEEATRAPAPDNTKLLQAASKCNALAAIGMERAGALVSITEAANGAPMPSACQ